MNVTYLCLGGNIGDREKALSHAIQKISEQVGVNVKPNQLSMKPKLGALKTNKLT
jgi:7,8-dihydro-6-hydroxymethylpterin-pyrophosphokinase